MGLRIKNRSLCYPADGAARRPCHSVAREHGEESIAEEYFRTGFNLDMEFAKPFLSQERVRPEQI
jgi:hypothetical protein